MTTQVRPENLTLVPGAMQNWSDLEHGAGADSPAARKLVRDAVSGARRVAVVGPHSPDLVVALADVADELVVFTRSIPDAVTFAQLLADVEGTGVVCGSLLHLPEPPAGFDLVIALDDVTRVASLETERTTWQELLDAVLALVADDGQLLLAVENELGLHRMAALRSRFTTNDDSSWLVTETFDRTRPRSREQLAQQLTAAGLNVGPVGSAYPLWSAQEVFALGDQIEGGRLAPVLAAAVLRSASLRRAGADPTRVTRAAVLSQRLPEFASGWVVRATRGDNPASDVSRIVASTLDGRAETFQLLDQTLQRLVGDDHTDVEIPSHATPFGEELLDTAADSDLIGLGSLMRRLKVFVDHAAIDDVLPAAAADVRVDNLLYDDQTLYPLSPAAADAPAQVALWVALADVVAIIRARGARHPWPAATDDQTMMASLCALAEVPLPDDIDTYLPTTASAEFSGDVSGMIALVERLTETNKALASRATWFEQRLASTERDLQVRTERHRTQLAAATRQQEVLRGSAEDLRRSLTYRVGNAVLGPVRDLRNRTRD